MCALLSGSEEPSAQELAERARFRAAHNAKEAPATLGDPPMPPPDPSGLPPAAGRAMRAMGVALGELFGSSEAEHEEDVLLTESTSEAFNILLPLLGAIVTDSGGLLSHSAIVAREYGIPGVVGTRDATDRIPDGARIRVDGEAGEVTVLA